MKESTCIVIGASHSGVALALQLRKEGWQGGIRLIGAEAELPYHRPPLSKELLAGTREPDSIRLRPAKVFADNDIELMTGTRVMSIQRDSKSVVLDSGEELAYEKLALCTGAVPRTLPGSGHSDRVLYLRTLTDVAAIRERSRQGDRVVIVGGGYIGLETAAVLVRAGLEVTLLEAEQRLLARVTSTPMSSYIQALHSRHGVDIRTSARLTELSEEGAELRLRCSDQRELRADFLIVGIGIEPDTRLAQEAGLRVADGVLVDAHCRTSDPDIFASGDCARFPSALYGRELRLESVQNANDQGRAAAANLCGKRVAYGALPWFWSDQYELKLQMVGLSDGHDQIVCRGDPEDQGEAGFALYYLQKQRLLAVDCVSRPKEFMLAKKWLQQGLRVDPARLADEGIAPDEIIPKA